MNKISIFSEVNRKSYKIKMIKIIKHILKKHQITNGIINIIIVDDEKIKEINKAYRNIDNITDVISFALEDSIDPIKTKYRILGDIYISLETAYRQAQEYEHTLERELLFLTTHGVLHLLGYDHIKKKDEKIMFDLQEMVLNEFRIKR